MRISWYTPYCFGRQWKSLRQGSLVNSLGLTFMIPANIMSGLVRKDARGLDRTSSSGMNDRGHPMLVPSRAIAHALQRRNDLWTRTDGCPVGENSRFASLLCPRAPRARNAAALIETCTCINELWELASCAPLSAFFSLALLPVYTYTYIFF